MDGRGDKGAGKEYQTDCKYSRDACLFGGRDCSKLVVQKVAEDVGEESQEDRGADQYDEFSPQIVAKLEEKLLVMVSDKSKRPD
ncbi:MAG: hypothetical protein EOP10_29735 [Proteobacteria bacterium]|nr:MAG: hypothetical protein EOP10_29735 [Pseudomonadota bacterium]